MQLRSALRWMTPTLFGLMVSLCCSPAWSQEAAPPEAKAEAKAETPATPAAETPPAVEPAPDAPPPPTAASVAEGLASLTKTLDILWLCLAAFFVFFMQAGFALVEAGFTRAKNTVNILMKNFLDFSFGSLAFWLIGFGLMYGADYMGLIGLSKFAFSGLTEGAVDNKEMANWIFQVVFAATAATIVSGAMAERTNFSAYLIYSVVISTFIYPIAGHWSWGGGWLTGAEGFVVKTFGTPFHDFAGSTVVHSVGGWCALAGAICLGPRIGRYLKDGKLGLMPGHNLALATLGTFILWLGWFGFNPGSTLALGTGGFAHVAVTTNLAACAGSVMALIVAKAMFGTFDLSMTCNGALAGLVAITAPCAVVSPLSSIIIGSLAGVIVVFSVVAVDKIKIDDPVGAISVHLVNGAFGTLCVGLFAEEIYATSTAALPIKGLFFGGGVNQLMAQLVGIGATAVWTLPLAFITFKLCDLAVGLRVSEEVEMTGLDIHEHGIYAYPPQMVTETSPGVGSMPTAGGMGHAAVPQMTMSAASK